jgi:glutathione S-transferase
MGDTFGIDCSTAPVLFYANKMMPLDDGQKNAARYLDRLLDCPSFARVVKEAQP